VIPLSVLAVAAWFYARPHRTQIVADLVDPAKLLRVTIGLGVALLLWVALIVGTYRGTRPRSIAFNRRLAGNVFTSLLCLVVAAPLALGGYYAMVQRDLVKTVFKPTESTTTPHVTKANPWGKRKRVNLLLLGGDGDTDREGVRTDSVILASIDVRTGKTILFSLPRNLENVPFPANSPLARIYPNGFDGGGDPAEWFLNAIYRNVPALNPGVLGKTSNEGADAVKLGVSGSLGIPVDYYMLINFKGFQRIVDAIGGITVNVDDRVPINGDDDAHIPPTGYIEPGPDQHLDGFHALWFARGRYGLNDYNRMQRQRCAINAIVAKADPLTLLRRYTALASATKKILRTDIPQKLLPAFVNLTTKMKAQPLRSVVFQYDDNFNPNDPDFDYVHATVKAALKPTTPGSTPTKSATGGTGTTQPPDTTKVGTATAAAADCTYQPSQEALNYLAAQK
jgi:LCP family protein required for cell wall assembly